MTDSEYQATIHGIVNEVDRLVTKNPAIRDMFTGHIDRLCEMVEGYGEAQEPYSEELEKTRKQIEKCKNKKQFINRSLTDICPPPQGYVKINCWDNEFVNVPMGTIYRPAEPVNPLLWLGIFGSVSIQRKPTENEKLMCQYVLLAINHDFELRFSGTPTDSPICSSDYHGKWFEWAKFCEEVWKYYHYPVHEAGMNRYHATPQEKLSRLNRAIVHVKADIEKKIFGKNENTSIEKKQTYSEFLQDIAEQVHPLIRDHRERFEQQAHEFINQYEAWYNQRSENIKIALENPAYHSKEKPDKRPKKVPKEYVLFPPGDQYEYQTIKDGEVIERGSKPLMEWYWGKPLPNNPMDTLQSDFGANIYAERGEFLREPKTPEEDLLRKYFLLTAIYADKGHGISILKKSVPKRNEDLTFEMYAVGQVLDFYGETYWDNKREQNWGLKHRAFIRTALTDVKADLNSDKIQPIESTDKEQIVLKRSDFGKRRGKFMKLLEDLEGRRPGETVTLTKSRHGTDPVETLKDALKNICPDLARKIHRKGNTAYCDVIIKIEI